MSKETRGVSTRLNFSEMQSIYEYCFRILYCEKCMVLIKRPPDRAKLMELRSKDLQDYLNKNNVSTYGLLGMFIRYCVFMK